VSAFEPEQPAEPKVDMPDFMVVLRGYDRRQVEMWASEVANQIQQERLRADQAEKRLYRMQIENKGAASFSHLGSHVASILEEAGRSSENMLADAAERARETIEAAEAEAAEIVKAAEHRVGEIEHEARRTLESARAEVATVEEDALQAAEDMRAQAEQDARTVLEEARDATDLIWQEAERERVTVEAETIRLETLRHRSLEQLGRVYGHLESVLDEVRAGMGRVDEEQDEAEAQAAAAARLGVEPPTAAGRPGEPAEGDEVAADRPETAAPAEAAEAPAPPAGQEQATLPDGSDVTGASEVAGDAETTQPAPPATTETAQDAADTQPVPQVPAAPDGEGGPGDQEATQRLEPIGGKSRSRPAGRQGKDRP
jgi:hypothetical protein